MSSSQADGARPIVIACGADECYAMPLAVTLSSALRRLRPGTEALVFILATGFTSESRMRVEHVLRDTNANVRIEWVVPDVSAFDALPAPKHLAASCYLRLLLPQVIPNQYEKVLYIDSDVLVLDDLTTLWDTPLHGKAVLAVPDFHIPTISCPMGLRDWRSLGLDGDAPYLNSGVMLIDLAWWREHDVARRVADYCIAHADTNELADQDGLNAVLAGEWSTVDPRWNVQADIGRLGEIPEGVFKKQILGSRRALVANPGICHFTSNRKPWTRFGFHPRRLDWVWELLRIPWFRPVRRTLWLAWWASGALYHGLRYRFVPSSRSTY